MHFAFILKCELNGKVFHMPWQRLAETKKEAEKRVRESFERDNIYAPGIKTDKNCAKLLEIIDFGESKDGVENSAPLYDSACTKAAKMDAKSNPPTPVQG